MRPCLCSCVGSAVAADVAAASELTPSAELDLRKASLVACRRVVLATDGLAAGLGEEEAGAAVV